MTMIKFDDYKGLHTVVSGGQTGSDQAGLYVARSFNLKTMGIIPKGYRTQAGPMPSLGVDYGLLEHSSPDYPPRTKLNAQLGDATVRLASNFSSAGEKLTLKYCKELKKPHFDVQLGESLTHKYDNFAEELAEFLRKNAVGTLNVAGNSDKDDLNGMHFNHARYVLEVTFQILEFDGLLIPSDDC